MKRSERDVEHFDKWSATYEDSWLQRALFDRVHKATLEIAVGIIEKPEVVLDVGCGTGKLLRKAAGCWPEARLIGIDPAEGMIEMARNLMPDAAFYTSMAESLPLDDDSVDLALSTSSFHHWQNQRAALKEIARVLRHNGCFILVDDALPEWLKRIFRIKRVHSRDGLKKLFAEAGLQVQTQQKVPSGLATVGVKQGNDL